MDRRSTPLSSGLPPPAAPPACPPSAPCPSHHRHDQQAAFARWGMIWKKSPPTSRAGRYSLSITSPGIVSTRLRQNHLLHLLGLLHIERHQPLCAHRLEQPPQQQQAAAAIRSRRAMKPKEICTPNGNQANRICMTLRSVINRSIPSSTTAGSTSQPSSPWLRMPWTTIQSSSEKRSSPRTRTIMWKATATGCGKTGKNRSSPMAPATI